MGKTLKGWLGSRRGWEPCKGKDKEKSKRKAKWGDGARGKVGGRKGNEEKRGDPA